MSTNCASRVILVAIFCTALIVVLLNVVPAQAQTYTDLFNFGGSPGPSHPAGSLAQGRDGNLYGVDYDGGSKGNGSVFRMTPRGALTTIYSFASLDYCIIGLWISFSAISNRPIPPSEGVEQARTLKLRPDRSIRISSL